MSNWFKGLLLFSLRKIRNLLKKNILYHPNLYKDISALAVLQTLKVNLGHKTELFSILKDLTQGQWNCLGLKELVESLYNLYP